eukprot:6924-Heterococcus_DN1.PRE.7
MSARRARACSLGLCNQLCSKVHNTPYDRDNMCRQQEAHQLAEGSSSSCERLCNKRAALPKQPMSSSTAVPCKA